MRPFGTTIDRRRFLQPGNDSRRFRRADVAAAGRAGNSTQPRLVEPWIRELAIGAFVSHLSVVRKLTSPAMIQVKRSAV